MPVRIWSNSYTEDTGFAYTADRTVKQKHHCGKLFAIPLKLNICIPCDPVIPFLRIYATLMHTCICQKICIHKNVHNIICKNWK